MHLCCSETVKSSQNSIKTFQPVLLTAVIMIIWHVPEILFQRRSREKNVFQAHKLFFFYWSRGNVHSEDTSVSSVVPRKQFYFCVNFTNDIPEGSCTPFWKGFLSSLLFETIGGCSHVYLFLKSANWPVTAPLLLKWLQKMHLHSCIEAFVVCTALSTRLQLIWFASISC